MIRTRWLVVLALLACEGPGAMVDSAMPVDASGPATPLSPSLLPCSTGWRVVDVDGTSACEPWPETGHVLDCPPGEAHLVGTPGCAPLTTPCAADGWPTDLPTDRPIVFVDDDAPAGGDGRTRATAWRTIGGALASSAPNAVIAVAAGHYDDATMVVTDTREVRGACAAATIVTTSAPGAAAVELMGGGCAVRDLTVASPERFGIAVHASGVIIEGVVVTGARAVGIAVLSGDATIRSVRIADVRPSTTSGAGERGIDVERASATLAGVEIVRARETGLFVGGVSTRVTATELAIAGTISADDGTLGRGIEVRAGASLMLAQAVIEDVRDMGVTANDPGTTASIEDVVVRRIGPELASGEYGRGLDVELGAHGTVTRVRIDGATEAAVLASGAGAVLDVTDLVVTDTRARADGRRGRGLDVEDHASVSVTRARVLRSTEMGAFTTGEGALSASDLEIASVASRPLDGTLGAGVWAQQGGSVTLVRALVTGARFVGIASVDHGAVSLADVVVREVTPSTCAAGCADIAGGHAASSHFGSTFQATRFEIGHASVCGVVVGEAHPDGTATGMDLENGVVASVPVGACVQVDGFDTARLHDHVAFVDVDVPLQATHYALPMVD